MRGHFIRPVSMVVVAFAVCSPALVRAQIRIEIGEISPLTQQTVRSPEVPAQNAAPGLRREPAKVEFEVASEKVTVAKNNNPRVVEIAPLEINREHLTAVIEAQKAFSKERQVNLFLPTVVIGNLNGNVNVKMAFNVVEKNSNVAKNVVIRKRVERPVAIAAPVQIVINNQNMNGMIQQWTTQFRPILRAEYMFVRVVCNPTKEERVPIARAGLKSLEAAAKKYVEWQTNQNRVVNGQLVERPEIPNPRKFIQEALIGAVKAELSASQAEKYRVELEARAAETKRAGVLTLLAKLDRQLILTPEQYDKIKESLSSHWNEEWSQGLQNLNVDDQYFPTISDSLISSHLNPEQKSVWVTTPKVSYNSFGGGFGGNQANGALDDEFTDEDAMKDGSEAKADAEKKP